MDLLLTIDTNDSLFIPGSTVPGTLLQQPVQDRDPLDQDQDLLDDLFGEEDDSCNEEDTDAEDVMNESATSSTTTEDSYNMAKHGKPKQVNRFRGSDRAFRKGHSAYNNTPPRPGKLESQRGRSR
jgi:hypothetical protein